MTRKLFLALSLVTLSWSSASVFALGVGEANVRSSLNQPLAAEIQLLSVGELSEAEILPALATREEFERAGVDRAFFLSDIRFNVVKNASGKLVISLSSKKPVREPYLNFLVEVIWPSGRLLREYSLLIDPPVFSQQVAAPVSAAQVSSASSATTRQPNPSNGPQGSSASQRVASGDRINLNTASSSVGSQSAGSLIPGDSYGPTKSDDTLWDLALRARPDRSLSPQQVMLAIQDANPDAFVDGNINKMKEGVVLRMPSTEQMSSRSKADAVNAVIAQNEALRPSRSKSIVSTTQPSGPSAVSDSAIDPRDELKLVVASSGSNQTTSANSGSADVGSGSVSKEELALTLEKLDQAVSEKKELSGRVSDLEEQLETLQRLLTLKNDQLANMQEQTRANAMAEETQVKAAETTGTAGTETPTTPPTDVSVPGTEETPAVSDAVATEPASEIPAEPLAGAEALPTETASQADPVAQPVVQQVAQPEEALAKQEDASDKPFMEKLFADPIYMAAASIGILVLMILVWMVSRNNARKEEALRGSTFDDHEDLFDGAPHAHSELSVDDDNALDEVDLDSDKDSLAEGESKRADVIAEADVYVAYGRLDRAADILEQAIADEPLRTDLRLKLLEVYKESGSRNEFERQFSELEAIGDKAAIALASQLRKELRDRESSSNDDDLALSEDDFNTGSSLTSSQREDLDGDEDSLAQQSDLEREVMDSFDFDETEKVGQLEESEPEIDFDAEDIDLDIDVTNDFEDDRDESFESGLSLDLDEESEPAAKPRRDMYETSSADEFDLSDDLADASVDLDLSDIELSDELEQEKEIDIPEDLSLPDDLTDARAPNKPSAPVVSDDILTEAEEAFKDVSDLDAGIDDEEEFDFLDGADEASTKLDLARAYIDMGDLDGARDILEEVCKEGNVDQQKEAKSLLGELDE